jgi:hypothetical protein
MPNVTTKPDSSQLEPETAPQLFDNWFDPIETEVRARAREFRRANPRRAQRCAGNARVTGEARWPAVKEERALRATATAAGRGR